MHQENEIKDLGSSAPLTTDDPDLIRKQIKATQADLIEKLGDLGDGVQDKVVETIVDFTVHAKNQLRDALDIEAHTRRRPLTMLGASVAVGALLARSLSKRRKARLLNEDYAFAPVNAKTKSPFGRTMLLEVFVPVGLSLLQQSVKNLGQKQAAPSKRTKTATETEELDLDDLPN